MKNSSYIVLFSLLVCISGMAQEKKGMTVRNAEGRLMLPEQPGYCEVLSYYDDDYARTLPPVMLSLFEDSFDKITGAFLKHPLLTPPTGFAVNLCKRIDTWDKPLNPGDFPLDPEPILAGDLELVFAPYFLSDDRPFPDFYVSSRLNIYINNPYLIAGTPVMADIYPCPQVCGDFHGNPVYLTDREEVTLVNYTGLPVFLPVSREEFILTLITYWETKRETDRQANSEAEEAYQDLTNEETLAQQKEDFERAYNELLKYDRSAAEELKKQFEEVMEMLSDNRIGQDLEESMSGSVSFADEQIVGLKRELAALSPGERKQQAWYSLAAFEKFDNLSGLLPESYKKEGDALVRINPELVSDESNSIRLLCMQWHLLDSEHYDSPRQLRQGSEPDQICDNKMLELYQDKNFWEQLLRLFK